jgi:hypothetical protein
MYVLERRHPAEGMLEASTLSKVPVDGVLLLVGVALSQGADDIGEFAGCEGGRPASVDCLLNHLNESSHLDSPCCIGSDLGNF